MTAEDDNRKGWQEKNDCSMDNLLEWPLFTDISKPRLTGIIFTAVPEVGMWLPVRRLNSESHTQTFLHGNTVTRRVLSWERRNWKFTDAQDGALLSLYSSVLMKLCRISLLRWWGFVVSYRWSGLDKQTSMSSTVLARSLKVYLFKKWK